METKRNDELVPDNEIMLKISARIERAMNNRGFSLAGELASLLDAVIFAADLSRSNPDLFYEKVIPYFKEKRDTMMRADQKAYQEWEDRGGAGPS